jgi:hypothetical protein
MTVIEQLASALSKRDEVPNQELAARIVLAKDKDAVRELVENLDNKKKDIQSDCIKTLYEIAEKAPELVSGHGAAFVKLLDHKNPRLVWGAMTALSAIVNDAPSQVFDALPKIMYKADHSGSVIARDHAVYILAKLALIDTYYDDCYALISEQLLKAPVNQFPMYAEITAPAIRTKEKPGYKTILTERLADIAQEPKRKRIEKVLKKFFQ